MPGAFVIEWMVCCRRDSATAKGDSVAKDITYLKLGQEAVYPRCQGYIYITAGILPATRSHLGVKL